MAGSGTRGSCCCCWRQGTGLKGSHRLEWEAVWEAAAGTRVGCCSCSYNGTRAAGFSRGWKGGSIGGRFWNRSVLLLLLLLLLEAGNRASGFPEAGMGATWEAAAGTRVLLLRLQFKWHQGSRIPRGWKGGSIGGRFWH